MSTFVLPKLGTHEDQELDFKYRLNTKDGKTDYLELTKDMAAMANAYGGTIIIGACEDPKGVLSIYKPMTEDEAVFACNEYKTAQRDRLRPAVIVLPEMRPHDEGFLVTVKVEASVGQAIAVRFIPKVDVEPETKATPEIYGFPLRVGDNTTWLQPEQLPMLMIPELRRKILLLKQIGGNTVKVDCLFRGGGANHSATSAPVGFLDVEGNAVHIGGHVIPLDQIRTVVREADGWHVVYNSSH